MNQIELVLAAIADIPAIERVCANMWRSSRYAKFEYSAEQIITKLKSMVSDPRYIIILAVSNSVIVGALVAQLSEMIFARRLIASDLLFFIERDYRSFSLSKRMVERYTLWARMMGAAEMTIGVSSANEIEKLDRLFLYLGLTKVGGIYVKAL